MNVHLVKIGSDSISNQNIDRLCQDIEFLQQKTGEKVILISSGAVKLGKQHIGHTHKSAAFYAGLGQKKLINLYEKYYRGKVVGLVNDDYDKERDMHLVRLLSEYIENDILPIVNYNDAMSDDELKHLQEKADNDNNALHIACNIIKYGYKLQSIIYLTKTNGILDFKGETLQGGYVSKENISIKQQEVLAYVQDRISENGTGGMQSKIQAIFTALNHGIPHGIIANANTGLDCLLDNKSQYTQYILS